MKEPMLKGTTQNVATKPDTTLFDALSKQLSFPTQPDSPYALQVPTHSMAEIDTTPKTVTRDAMIRGGGASGGPLRITQEQVKRVFQLISQRPEADRQRLIAQVAKRSPEWAAAMEPWEWYGDPNNIEMGAEMDEAVNGLIRGMTFGIANPEPNSHASVAELGGYEMRPMGMAGEAVGSILPSNVVERLGARAAEKMGLRMAREAGESFLGAKTKGEALSTFGRRRPSKLGMEPSSLLERGAYQAVKHGIGTVTPGFVSGVIQGNDQDPNASWTDLYNYGINNAASWVAGGLISEAGFALIKRGLRKKLTRGRMDEKDVAGVRLYDDLANDPRAIEQAPPGSVPMSSDVLLAQANPLPAGGSRATRAANRRSAPWGKEEVLPMGSSESTRPPIVLPETMDRSVRDAVQTSSTMVHPPMVPPHIGQALAQQIQPALEQAAVSGEGAEMAIQVVDQLAAAAPEMKPVYAEVHDLVTTVAEAVNEGVLTPQEAGQITELVATGQAGKDVVEAVRDAVKPATDEVAVSTAAVPLEKFSRNGRAWLRLTRHILDNGVDAYMKRIREDNAPTWWIYRNIDRRATSDRHLPKAGPAELMGMAIEDIRIASLPAKETRHLPADLVRQARENVRQARNAVANFDVMKKIFREVDAAYGEMAASGHPAVPMDEIRAFMAKQKPLSDAEFAAELAASDKRRAEWAKQKRNTPPRNQLTFAPKKSTTSTPVDVTRQRNRTEAYAQIGKAVNDKRITPKDADVLRNMIATGKINERRRPGISPRDLVEEAIKELESGGKVKADAPDTPDAKATERSSNRLEAVRVIDDQKRAEFLDEALKTAKRKAREAQKTREERLAREPNPKAELEVGKTYVIKYKGKQESRVEVLSYNREHGIYELSALDKTGRRRKAMFLGDTEVESFAPWERHGRRVHPEPEEPKTDRTGITEPMMDSQREQIVEMESQMLSEGLEPPDRLHFSRMSVADARAHVVAMREKMNAHKTALEDAALRDLERMRGSDSGAPPKDPPDAPPGASRYGDVTEDEFKDMSFLGYLGITPQSSKWGLGGTVRGKMIVDMAQDMMRRRARDTTDYMRRYIEIIKPLSTSTTEHVNAKLGSAAAREKVQHVQQLKALLGKALNGEGTAQILEDRPELKPIYNELRTMLDELANKVGLAPGKRIEYYFPHLFNGQSGLYRATRMVREVGVNPRTLQRFMEELPIDADRMAKERFAWMTRSRTGKEGWSHDLDSVMMAYINGAVDKPYMQSFLDRARVQVDRMPLKDARGFDMHLQGKAIDYVNYVAGRPTAMRESWTRVWRDNRLFNDWCDKAVEFFGEAEDKGFLASARNGSAEAQLKAEEYFNQLLKDANAFTADGMINDVEKTKAFRAKLALMIDDIRVGMTDPYARPVVMEKLYQVMVLNKLLFNASYGLVNTTQILTNVMPALGVRGVAKAIQRHAGDPDFQFESGRSVRDVLMESGVSTDTPELTEFLPGNLGLMNKIIDVGMSPGRVSEKWTREVAFLGRYEANLNRGWDHYHSMADARQFVDKTMFPFNKAGTPDIMRPGFMRFLMMFQNYGIHQINFSAELLEEAIREKKYGPLARHLAAYLTIGGVGLLPGMDRLSDLAGHPIEEFTPQNFSDYGVGGVLGGPTATTMIELLHGQVGAAMADWVVPTVAVRAYQSASEPTAADAVSTALGFGPPRPNVKEKMLGIK